MPYLYIVGRDVVLTRAVADTMHITHATTTNFTPRMTIITTQFEKPVSPVVSFKERVCAQVARAACGGRVRVVCSRKDILAGVTINSQPLWSTPFIPTNADILFAQTLESYRADDQEPLYPTTTSSLTPNVFGRVFMIGGGQVYVKVDARGRRVRHQPGDYLTTPSGARLPEKWVLHTAEINHPCARLVREEVLPGGYHPVVASNTPNSMRLLVTPPSALGEAWCAHVVTTWSGEVMEPPVVLSGESLDAVLDVWATAVKALVCGEPGHHHPPQIHQLITRAQCECVAEEEEGVVRALEVGEHVAYLARDISPTQQHAFMTARVTGLNPFQLSNGHHATVFAGGVGELARYNLQDGTVVFPVFNLQDVV